MLLLLGLPRVAVAAPPVRGEARLGTIAAAGWQPAFGLSWGGQLRVGALAIGGEFDLTGLMGPPRLGTDFVVGGVFSGHEHWRGQGEFRVGVGTHLWLDGGGEPTFRWGGGLAVYHTPRHRRAAVGAYVHTYLLPGTFAVVGGLRFLVGDLRCDCRFEPPRSTSCCSPPSTLPCAPTVVAEPAAGPPRPPPPPRRCPHPTNCAPGPATGPTGLCSALRPTAGRASLAGC